MSIVLIFVVQLICVVLLTPPYWPMPVWPLQLLKHFLVTLILILLDSMPSLNLYFGAALVLVVVLVLVMIVVIVRVEIDKQELAHY